MRIESLTLKGITAFRGEASVDCTALPPGIVAIVGPNGHGKTTLLESLGPAPAFREFPSRAERPLVDYATGADSFLEQRVTFEGRGTYRLRVNLDGVKRATEAVLEQIGADGRRLPISDGKVKDYDRVIAGLFPSKELLLASSFAAQNRRGSFVTGSRTDRKALFSEMLGLGHYERMTETARTIAAALDRRRTAIVAVLERLEAATDANVLAHSQREADRLQGEIGRLGALQGELEAEVTAADRAVADARVALDTAKEADRSRQDLARQYGAQDDVIRRIDHALVALDHEHTTRAEQLRQRQRAEEAAFARRIAQLRTAEAIDAEHDAALATIDEQLRADVADRETKIRNNEGLRAAADAIRADARALVERDAEISRRRAALTTRRAQVEQWAADAQGLRTALQSLAKIELELTQARRQAELLQQIPCGGVSPYDGCRLLTEAVAAKGRIPGFEARLDGVEDRRRELHDLDVRIAAERSAIADADQALATFERSGPDRDRVGKRVLQLDHAEDRIAELTDEIAALTTRADGDRRDVRSRCLQALAEIAERLADAQETNTLALAALGVEFETLQHETAEKRAALTTERADAVAAQQTIADALASAGPAPALTDLEGVLTARLVEQRTHQHALTQAIASRARIETEVRQQQARVTELQALIVERDAQRAVAAEVDADLVDWQTLAQAFGPQGLPVLEMDAAGPTVSDLTNDLLEHALGSRRFTVELVTQEAKAGGKGMKETFDLHVYDTDRGSAQRAVSDLSGGEQVLIDEALKGAIALFMNARNERPIRTCWRDETTGALDPENALRYMAMLRRIQERGGFERLFVISHNADAAALADAQLYVHDGRIDVRLAPFTQEAA